MPGMQRGAWMYLMSYLRLHRFHKNGLFFHWRILKYRRYMPLNVKALLSGGAGLETDPWAQS